MANGNGKNKKRKRWIYISASLVAIVIALVIFMGVKGGGTKIDSSKIAKVERGALAKSVVATGKVTPITKAEIKSKASGIVKRWLADAGQKVKAGQVLVEL